MPRGTKCRLVEVMPAARCFKPAGLPKSCLEEVCLKIEEVEAIRLKDYVGLEQEECANSMQISRPTFQRILNEAHAKIADALVNGKTIRIEGGNYCLGGGYCRRLGRNLNQVEECPVMNEIGARAFNMNRSELPPRVIISSNGDTPEAMVDGRFGRCQYFLLMGEEGLVKVLTNTGPETSHGAGTGAAQAILDSGAQSAVVSRIGPKAFAVLQKAGINVYLSHEQESVIANARLYFAGKLTRLEKANN